MRSENSDQHLRVMLRTSLKRRKMKRFIAMNWASISDMVVNPDSIGSILL